MGGVGITIDIDCLLGELIALTFLTLLKSMNCLELGETIMEAVPFFIELLRFM